VLGRIPVNEKCEELLKVIIHEQSAGISLFDERLLFLTL
jgi:hypothetical protein